MPVGEADTAQEIEHTGSAAAFGSKMMDAPGFLDEPRDAHAHRQRPCRILCDDLDVAAPRLERTAVERLRVSAEAGGAGALASDAPHAGDGTGENGDGHA